MVFMGIHGHYGYTCEKCPSRGEYGIVGDFVQLPYLRETTQAQTTFCNEGITNQIWIKDSHYVAIGYPDRCKECNARYQRKKRAFESIKRMEYARKTYEEFGGEKWKYLKFVTLTFPIEIGKESREDAINRIDKRYRKKREKLAELLDVKGGTDVLECVSKSTPSGTSHNVHYHCVWIMPKQPIKKIAKAMEKCGFGRDQVRALKETEWIDSLGRERTRDAVQSAAEYLSKYLSKENTHKRRKVWGDLREWKEYLDDEICRICVKTTHDIEKQYPCKCKP